MVSHICTALELGLHIPIAVGASETRVLDRLRGHQQLPHPVRPYVPATGRDLRVLVSKASIAGAALAAVYAGSAHWLLADWPTKAFLPKMTALPATVIAGGAAFAAPGVVLRIEEQNELIAMVKRSLRRGR